MELVENVEHNVKNVQLIQIIVIHATAVELQEVNQLAHAHLENTKTQLVGAKIVHSDVSYVLEPQMHVMNVQMSIELCPIVSVQLDTGKMELKLNVKLVIPNVLNVQDQLIIVILALGIEL